MFKMNRKSKKKTVKNTLGGYSEALANMMNLN